MVLQAVHFERNLKQTTGGNSHSNRTYESQPTDKSG